MADILWKLLERLADSPGPVTYLVIAFSGCIEYVFPPFPGDTVTLFAGFLVGAKGWSLPGVYLAVNGGSLVGTLVDYSFGVWLGASGRTWTSRGPRFEKFGRALDRTARGFEKHAALYLCANRFLPSLRALFFVAAGVARVPLWKVVTFGMLSSALWTLLILVVGRQVGYQKDRLLEFLGNYTAVAWIVVAVAAVAIALRWFYCNRFRSE